MPRRTTPLLAGEYYHLYNRGHNRQPIFFERENYLFFLRRVREYLRGETQTSEVWTSIVAYCLMPNHFHLLVCPHDDQLSRRLQRFSISYTKAMNNRYERTGALPGAVSGRACGPQRLSFASFALYPPESGGRRPGRAARGLGILQLP